MGRPRSLKLLKREGKNLSEHESCNVVFDDMLRLRNNNDEMAFLKKGKHKDLGVCCLSQSLFDSTKQL